MSKNEEEYIIGVVENEEKYQQYLEKEIAKMTEVSEFRKWNSAEEFLRDSSGMEIDLLFVDLQLSYMSGIDLVRELNRKDPEFKMVMLTNMSSDAKIFQALENGAIGYLWKSELDDIVKITRQVLKGGGIMTPTIAIRVLSSFRKPVKTKGNSNLTTREMQILELMVAGTSTAECAETLDITPSTVRTHMKNIYKKLNIHTQIEMMQKASDMGLI